MSDLKLLTISGSLRKASTNRKLAAEAAHRFGPAEKTVADIAFPVYDGDIEEGQGIPAEVQRLSDQIAAADAVVISTPEYNKGISGALKNALDWVSRTEGNPWRDKPVALMSAAAGRAGGERSQNMARLCLNPFRPHLLPGPEVFIGNTSKHWDDNDRLTDEFAIKLLTELMEGLRAAAEARRG
ncbi:chromate reductase [Roseivivax lentus]|uniref:Chromate reductase n=1 Tax=Roseivivax lentus TaxID=633194 RepID=A0A1N7JY88_9RHOB|nr:NAD(P)H-dependent oxidoreductase [Roseivivax lentus]SIS54164.1 chromate reductase [Roseivivax lentus]